MYPNEKLVNIIDKLYENKLRKNVTLLPYWSSGTETERKEQIQIEMDRNGQKQTDTDRYRQKLTERTNMVNFSQDLQSLAKLGKVKPI